VGEEEMTSAKPLNRVMFSSASDEWSTPEETYYALDEEFGFVDDACPLGGTCHGLMRDWQSPCFVNPPYSQIGPWMEKAKLESDAGKTVVLLVPARTDTRWFHDYAMKASEIRFIKGRLKFGGAKFNAPFPSCVVIFRGTAFED
jgi:phage N-6-adenine-methyltransferase